MQSPAGAHDTHRRAGKVAGECELEKFKIKKLYVRKCFEREREPSAEDTLLVAPNVMYTPLRRHFIIANRVGHQLSSRHPPCSSSSKLMVALSYIKAPAGGDTARWNGRSSYCSPVVHFEDKRRAVHTHLVQWRCLPETQRYAWWKARLPRATTSL